MSLVSDPPHRPTAESCRNETLQRVLEWKYGAAVKRGWGPALRDKFNYVTPDDIYEALIHDYVTERTNWLDVGCGRDIFPSNCRTAQILSERCKLLAGVDPDDNIDENAFVHRKEKVLFEHYKTDLRFELITLRMVAEHVSCPETVVKKLAELTASGGHVVIYTVSKWSPVSLLARVTPTAVHRIAKRMLWETEDRDTFPVKYRMNTRRALDGFFRAAGFAPVTFEHLDDCRLLQRWKMSSYMELRLRQVLRSVGASYPEKCILAVYRKSQGASC